MAEVSVTRADVVDALRSADHNAQQDGRRIADYGDVADMLFSRGLIRGPLGVIRQEQVKVAAGRIADFSGRSMAPSIDLPLAYQMFVEAGFAVEDVGD